MTKAKSLLKDWTIKFLGSAEALGCSRLDDGTEVLELGFDIQEGHIELYATDALGLYLYLDPDAENPDGEMIQFKFTVDENIRKALEITKKHLTEFEFDSFEELKYSIFPQLIFLSSGLETLDK